MKDIEVLWLCTCTGWPVGIVKAFDEIVQGAPQMTPEYRQNLEHGIQKLDKAVSQIMEE